MKSKKSNEKKWVPRHRMQCSESADRQERAIEKALRQEAKKEIEKEVKEEV